MGKTSFLPKGLTYRKVEREPRWVTLDVVGADETAPPFQVLLKFMSAKRHAQIFSPVARARGDEDQKSALQKAQRIFVTELLGDWRNFTIPVHNAIVRADHRIEPESFESAEDVEAYNKYLVEGMPFDVEFAISVYANSEADKFQNLLVAALTAFHDEAKRIETEGNGGSRTSAEA